jgi:hypothetical protein
MMGLRGSSVTEELAWTRGAECAYGKSACCPNHGRIWRTFGLLGSLASAILTTGIRKSYSRSDRHGAASDVVPHAAVEKATITVDLVRSLANMLPTLCRPCLTCCWRSHAL